MSNHPGVRTPDPVATFVRSGVFLLLAIPIDLSAQNTEPLLLPTVREPGCGEVRTCAWPPVASLVLPGAGQWMLGQGRTYAYGGVEVGALVAYVERRGDGRRFRDRYRDLAWEVARRSFESPRVDGDFEFYEAMSRFQASGAFDAEPDRAGLQPETDPATFNGQIWALAREIHLPDAPVDETSPEYVRALDLYRERSIRPELRWDWSGAAQEWERFQGLIEKSDTRFRQATIALTLLAANHVVSAVDAFLSARLGGPAGEPSPLSLHAGPHARGGWAVQVRLRP